MRKEFNARYYFDYTRLTVVKCQPCWNCSADVMRSVRNNYHAINNFRHATVIDRKSATPAKPLRQYLVTHIQHVVHQPVACYEDDM